MKFVVSDFSDYPKHCKTVQDILPFNKLTVWLNREEAKDTDITEKIIQLLFSFDFSNFKVRPVKGHKEIM